MQDNIYRIRVQSPMGVKKGTAEIHLQDGRIILELLGGENLFTGSFIPKYAFQMTGLRTAVSEVPGVLKGTLSEAGLRAVLHTEKGDFPIEGVLSGHTDECL